MMFLPIRTERLTLRDFRADDPDDVQVYASDPEVARFMPWGPNTREETKVFIDTRLAAQADWPRLTFDLAIERAGLTVGSVGLRLRDGPNRTAEIGYCLRRDLWRQGLMTEAARALIDVGFRALGLHRVVATCNTENAGSFRVMEALGMRREGGWFRDQRVKGEWRNTYLYAVLAEEWLGR
jgi:RimJ/RimL family protein N-acetyltransferase